MKLRGSIQKTLTLAIASSLLLTACSKKDDLANMPDPVPTTTTPLNVITQPVTLNLLMVNDGGYVKRLLMPITQIGSKTVNLKTVFDTGSEGMVLNAGAVLPQEMITQNGIDLKGQTSLTIDGITITNARDSTSYGEPPYTRKYYGQIAYATMVLGDDAGNVTTREMSVFLVYNGIKTATGKHAPLDPDPMVDGICGVNNQVISNADRVASRSQMKGPFSYLDYGAGVNAGMSLSALNAIQNADVINQSGSRIIYSAPLLQVGIDPGSETDYIMQQQGSAANGAAFSPQVHGTIYADGDQFAGAILFDTGTATGGSISDPDTPSPDPYVLDSNMPVYFSTNEGFSYQFNTDKNEYRMRIVPNQSGKLGRSILGLEFFTNHYFLLDYTSNQIGIGDL
ncbi:hypothetical protein [Chitinophaga arvensicola]|uniref:Aspartyl protease n=1 Tax=Chitinophaga arvensicola TaxID=29529 RepID=A0A1I0SAB9_9BACT|nr:hypothetical protein [Chitinophaga arvensicola]SEW53379.1 hypothetical protein SAMN04488122_5437 [Chitinophaga arvensicola]